MKDGLNTWSSVPIDQCRSDASYCLHRVTHCPRDARILSPLVPRWGNWDVKSLEPGSTPISGLDASGIDAYLESSKKMRPVGMFSFGFVSVG